MIKKRTIIKKEKVMFLKINLILFYLIFALSCMEQRDGFTQQEKSQLRNLISQQLNTKEIFSSKELRRTIRNYSDVFPQYPSHWYVEISEGSIAECPCVHINPDALVVASEEEQTASPESSAEDANGENAVQVSEVEAQPAEETVQPTAEAAEETVQPTAEAEAQPTEETVQPTAEAEAQPTEETVQPASEPDDQAEQEQEEEATTQPEAHPESEAEIQIPKYLPTDKIALGLGASRQGAKDHATRVCSTYNVEYTVVSCNYK